MICGSARFSILSVRRVFAKSKNLKVSLLVRLFTMSRFARSKNLKVLLLSHLTFREVRQT